MPQEEHGRVCPPSVIKWLNSPFRKLIQNPQKMFGEYVNPGNIVIDLGCGGGFFSVELARMVGEGGRVIAVDLQREMLEITRRFATRKGVIDRITLHKCEENDLGFTDTKVDFALAFYMVHEVPDRRRLLQQVAGLLKPEARFYLIEPNFEVDAARLKVTVREAEAAGLKGEKPIKRLMSRGMVFQLI